LGDFLKLALGAS